MSDETTTEEESTETVGRIDIVIFPDGRREILYRRHPDPDLDERYYMHSIDEFVEANIPESTPVMYTGYFRPSAIYAEIDWVDYEGQDPVES